MSTCRIEVGGKKVEVPQQHITRIQTHLQSLRRPFESIAELEGFLGQYDPAFARKVVSANNRATA
jgi:hypothetical protein